MKKGSIFLDKAMTIGDTDDRLWSSFVEHLGRVVYGGIYDPHHPTADEKGFRRDVAELVKELGVSLVRYPGGNFVSGYNWKDGIGDKALRPRRLELAWHSIESNEVGIDEFYDWSRMSGTSIMGAVNMGTGTPLDAEQLVEYCNFPSGTYWSDLRIKNGHTSPYGIKTWCIGNEMDGPWQICHLEAHEYGVKAREAVKMMKLVDPSIEGVLCGSASSLMDTYPQWDRTVLECAYDNVDYLSLHRYYENYGNDDDFLSSFFDMDKFIKTVASTVDYVKAEKRSNKTINLSFDEWNVWYQQNQKEHDWVQSPSILEDRYSLLDALVFAGMGMTLLNNADRVKIACLAQLVNAIAPILTETGGRVIKQTIFYPFKELSHRARGTVLRPAVSCHTLNTRYGEVPVLHTSAVIDRAGSSLNVFCLNISKEKYTVTIDAPSLGKIELSEHLVLSGADLNAKNTFENPDAVKMVRKEGIAAAGERQIADIEPLSWNVFSFKI